MTDRTSPDSWPLLPCPFCNRELEHDPSISATFHPKIPYEEYCPLKGFLFASDRQDVIRAWNTRKPGHAPRSDLEPVAWMSKPGGACTSEKSIAEVWRTHYGIELVPLYASPDTSTVCTSGESK